MFGHPGNGYGGTIILNTFTIFAGIFISDISNYLYFGRDKVKLFRDFLADVDFKASASALSVFF
jgi:hypothetical protein